MHKRFRRFEASTSVARANAPLTGPATKHCLRLRTALKITSWRTKRNEFSPRTPDKLVRQMPRSFDAGIRNIFLPLASSFQPLPRPLRDPLLKFHFSLLLTSLSRCELPGESFEESPARFSVFLSKLLYHQSRSYDFSSLFSQHRSGFPRIPLRFFVRFIACSLNLSSTAVLKGNATVFHAKRWSLAVLMPS